MQKPGTEKQQPTLCSLIWREKLWKWVGRDEDGALLTSFFLTAFFLLPHPKRWPHLFTLLFLFAQLWFARGKRCPRESCFPFVTYLQNRWCRYPLENLSHILFRDIQPYTAHPATAACLITHEGDICMERNGFVHLVFWADLSCRGWIGRVSKRSPRGASNEPLVEAQKVRLGDSLWLISIDTFPWQRKLWKF